MVKIKTNSGSSGVYLKQIKTIHRNKGLGEMSPQAWKYIMGRESYTKIEAPDCSEAKEMLNICFGKDSSLRKELLIDSDGQESGAIDKSVLKVSKKTKVTKKKSSKKVGKKKVAKNVAKKKATKKATKKKVAKKTGKKKATKKKR